MKPTRQHWMLLAVAAALCAAITTAPLWWRPPAPDPTALDGLMAERTGLAGASDEALAKLRRQKSFIGVAGWTQAGLSTFQRQLGTAWQWSTGVANPQAASFTLSRNDATFTDWPEVLQTVRTLEAQPDLVVSEIELVAAGTRFTRVAFTIRIRWQQGDPAPGPQSPRPVARLSAGPDDGERHRAVASSP